MFRLINFFKQNLAYLAGLYILIQFIYIIFFPVQYRSDSLYYYKLAQECLSSNSFYPAQIHLYEDYIAAPLYVNLLVIILTIFNSTLSIGILNICLNILQLFILYKITLLLFGENTAKITAVLYIFYLNTLGLVITNYTELFFGVLSLGSIYFFLRGKKADFFFAGVLAAASIGVRPLGWALITAYILIFIFKYFRKIKLYSAPFQLISGTAAFIILFGLFNLSHFGIFLYTSTTGPVNLLMGANEYATGSFKDIVSGENKPGFIPYSEKKTYIEKGEIWKARACDWIKAHPLKWLSLIPVKAGSMFLWDDFAVSPLMNMQDWDLYKIAKYVKENNSSRGLMAEFSALRKISYLSLQFLHYFYYITLIIFITAGIIVLRRNNGFNTENIIPLLFSIIGVVITLSVYGIPRYKYPFLIAMLPFAAFFLIQIIQKKEPDLIKSKYD
ncbi:MAG: hypothetical protein EHM47_15710 [Ignavibacteriales bacterium]|nr:MAG: hypothetical protein EHM47_15710 [Ignavibacteriales bacterium]